MELSAFHITNHMFLKKQILKDRQIPPFYTNCINQRWTIPEHFGEVTALPHVIAGFTVHFPCSAKCHKAGARFSMQLHGKTRSRFTS